MEGGSPVGSVVLESGSDDRPVESQPKSSALPHRHLYGALLAAVIVVTVGVPLLLACTTGSISIPHDDSWSYSKITTIFATTGHIRLQRWNLSSLIGQVVMLGPFGRSITVQQIAVAALAAISLWLTYRILSRRVSPMKALLGTAMVGAFPGVGLLATSFMSDIPTFAAMVGCLAIGDQALEKRSNGLLVIALAVGLYGGAIREQALAAPVALLVAAYVSWDRPRRRGLYVMGAVLCLAFGLFELWRHSLPYALSYDDTSLHLQLGHSVTVALEAYFTLSLILSPAILMASREPRSRSVGNVLGIGVFAIGLAFIEHFHGSIFLGDYLGPSGAYQSLDIGRHLVIPSAVMDVLIAISLVAGTRLVTIVVSNWRNLDPLMLWFTILTIAGTGAELVAGHAIFDRYLLVLLIPGTVICLRSTAFEPRGARLKIGLGITSLALLMVISLLITANGLARDAAQWHAAQNLVSAGARPTDIDAGFDWVGYHSPVPALPSLSGGESEFGFWNALFPRSRVCFAVSVSPIPGQRPVSQFHYRTFALLGSSYLDIYKVGSCSPPASQQ